MNDLALAIVTEAGIVAPELRGGGLSAAIVAVLDASSASRQDKLLAIASALASEAISINPPARTASGQTRVN